MISRPLYAAGVGVGSFAPDAAIGIIYGFVAPLWLRSVENALSAAKESRKRGHEHD